MRWFTLTFLEGVSQMQLSGLSHPEGSSCHSQSILLEPGIPTPPTPLLLVSQYSYPALPPLEMVALHALGKLIQNVPGLHFLVRTASTRQVSYAVPSSPHSCTSLLRIESEQEKGQPVSSSWLPFL